MAFTPTEVNRNPHDYYEWQQDDRYHRRQQEEIIIRNLPTNAPYSLMTNAVGLFVSQALRLSLRFMTERSNGYDYVHLLAYEDDQIVVGRIRLVPRRSQNYPHRFHCDHWGVLEFFEPSRFNLQTVAETLNVLVKQEPFQIMNASRNVVTADNLWFQVKPKAGGNHRPVMIQQSDFSEKENQDCERNTKSGYTTDSKRFPLTDRGTNSRNKRMGDPRKTNIDLN